jgi:hypothetical protein
VWWDEWWMMKDEWWKMKDGRWKMKDGERKKNVRWRMEIILWCIENGRWNMFVWWDLLHDDKIDLLQCGIFYGCIIRWVLSDDIFMEHDVSGIPFRTSRLMTRFIVCVWKMNDEWWMMNDEWWMMNDECWTMNDKMGMGK